MIERWTIPVSHLAYQSVALLYCHTNHGDTFSPTIIIYFINPS